MSDDSIEAISARRTTCGRCDCAGVRVDTDAGEIVGEGGAVVALVSSADETLLMCGRADGTALHLTLCDDCAEVRS